MDFNSLSLILNGKFVTCSRRGLPSLIVLFVEDDVTIAVDLTGDGGLVVNDVVVLSASKIFFVFGFWSFF